MVTTGVSLGGHQSQVDAAIARLDDEDLVGRVWRGDHTVWKDDPREITDRLGWLRITDEMRREAPELQSFASEAKAAGYKHVVLLGMGGSSLGPEVLRQTFGAAPGYPELIVLDSTVPATVRGISERTDPLRTLFVVSSKSGTTIEPLSSYKHFRGLVEAAGSGQDAGSSFVAVTDPDTPLAALARNDRFRHLFQNPPDIGGRYSVLSYFGLVPAALTGVDVSALLDRGDAMRAQCAASVPASENPGARLGAAMATLTLEGRDKLTLVASPAVASFGLWVEQLIAESTGKSGTGIVPVAGEPLAAATAFGDDRFFVYVRMDGDDNADTDAFVEAVGASGHPVTSLALRDRYDIGAEFFRWEFATAVAGALIGIHPFDQPNVQQAKDETSSMLQMYESSGSLPGVDDPGSLDALLSQARPGDYLAIMPYVTETPRVDAALAELRRAVVKRHRIATTLGYGPRFLHSTGQLHKGGPDTGLFLQLTEQHQDDVAIPGQNFTFGVLADAQALGDFRALQALGRRAARVQLGGDHEAGLQEMVQGIAG